MHRRRDRGFTLIELAVVTAIIGLLVAGAVTGIGALRINTAISESARSLDTAESLLRGFLAREARLPCPADPDLEPDEAEYGREARAATPADGCVADLELASTGLFRGTLPAETLGMPVPESTDGRGNQLFYLVTRDATLDDSLTSAPWDNPNPIVLWDDPTMPAGQEIVINGVVALMSAGPNGNGAYSSEGRRMPTPPAGADAELANQEESADVNLISTTYSGSEDEPFDDIVRVLTEEQLIRPLSESGDVQSKRAVTRSRMERIVDVIYGHAAADSTSHAIPDNGDASGTEASSGTVFPWSDMGLIEEDARDAWGSFLQYTVDADPEICSPDGASAESTDVLFSLISSGPDTPTVSHTRGEAAGRFITAGMTILPCP